MKYCIISCIFNNYEPIREPLKIDNECDYFVFTDNKDLKSKKWSVIYLPQFDNTDMTGPQKTMILKYTFYKLIPNVQQYDYFVVVDMSFQIKQSLRPIVEYIDRYKYDLSVALHWGRDNVIDEYRAWEAKGWDSLYCKRFLQAIKDDFPLKAIGLLETGFKVFKNTKEVLNLIDDIHNIMTYSCNNTDGNDQCYFTYMLYKYLDKLRIHYHEANLARFSEYMDMCWHGSNKVIGDIDVLKWGGKMVRFLGRYIYVTKNEEYKKS